MTNVLWVGVSQVARVLVAFASLAILSRLIAPAEFGAFAIVTAILGVAELFRDLGLSLAAIQADSLTADEQSNLFWVNTGVGVLLTLIGAALALPIANAYEDSNLTGLIALVSVSFTINGIAAQYRVSLVRAGRFRPLSIIDIAASLGSLLIAITLGLADFGAYALAVQSVGLATFTLIGLILLARWRPSLPKRRTSVRHFATFGGQLLVVQIISYVASNVDKVAIGKVYGNLAVGFYSKAFTLYLQPLTQMLSPFTNLVVSKLSPLRSQPSDYLRELLRVQLVSGYAGFATFAFAFGAAPGVINVLLGPNWNESISIFQILCLGGTFQLLGFIYYWLFLSMGATRVYLQCVAITQPLAILLILVSLPFGVHGVAWAASAGNFVEWLVPAIWGTRRVLRGSSRLISNARRPAVLALLVGAGAAAGSWQARGLQPGDLSQLALPLVGAAVAVGLLMLLSSGTRHDLSAAVGVARNQLRRGK